MKANPRGTYNVPETKVSLVGDMNMVEFENPGDEVFGIYEGLSDGKFGPCPRFHDPATGEVFHLRSQMVLLNAAEKMTPGKSYVVRWLGIEQTKSGQRVHTYNVFDMGDGSNFTKGGTVPGRGFLRPPPSGEDEVPF